MLIIFHAGELADNDYWYSIYNLLTDTGSLSADPKHWLEKNNEHYVLITKLIYALNILLTNGNNLGLSLFTWCVGLLQSILLIRHLPNKTNLNKALILLLIFMISAYSFSPRGAHNWMLGMSGSAWITANLFSLLAIFSLHNFVIYRYNSHLVLLVIFALLALATYSTALSLFPCLIIAAFVAPINNRSKYLIIFSCCSILLIYFLFYEKPAHHPDIQTSPLKLINYFAAFLGAPFSKIPVPAMLLGYFGLIISIFTAIFIWKDKAFRKSAMPWLIIQLYVCGNAAMASIARSGFGLEQALSSRYGSLPALFWLSWMALSLILVSNQIHKHLKSTLIVISFALTCSLYWNGFKDVKYLTDRSEKKTYAMASLYSHAFDLDLIHETMARGANPTHLTMLVKRLQPNSHIPFDGRFKDCPKLGNRISRIQQNSPVTLGSADKLKILPNRVIKALGRLNQTHKPRCIVMATGSGVVIGYASSQLTDSGEHRNWQGFGKIYDHDKIVKFYVLPFGQENWHPLAGTYKIVPVPPHIEKINPL